MKKLEEYKRFAFYGIIVISMGITFSTVLSEKFGSLGLVFISLGSLLLIIGMSKKRNSQKEPLSKDEVGK